MPSFGDPNAPIVVVGLAPAAHGANRTGRMFTGDRSGEFLYRSLHRTGFANQPTSVALDDGLVLDGCRITAIVRCAPPANRPSPDEIARCARWLRPELARPGVRVVVALGGMAFNQVLRLSRGLGWDPPSARPRFGHGVATTMTPGPHLLGSYHPSQQNTFTGKLTADMLDAVFLRARDMTAGQKP